MANQEQLEILLNGVETWNYWRIYNNKVGVDLSGAELSNLDLHGVELSKANLREARLQRANFNKAVLFGADLSSVDLKGSDCTNANLTGANMTGAYLEGAKLDLANLTRAILIDAKLLEADLSFAQLVGAKLNRARLFGAILKYTHLWDADLEDAYLGQADLSHANLSDAIFRNADLQEANLREADLNRADFSEADLSYTDLREAKFYGTNLIESDLRFANLDGAELYNIEISGAKIGKTYFGNVDLIGIEGLEHLEHAYPSTIGTDTLRRSGGRLPIAFLRGCGLSDLDIEYAKLANSDLSEKEITDITYKIHDLRAEGVAVQYYSTFISYSSKDEDFAQRLYNGLQGNGVRCWFAPENLKIGDQIRPRIDQEIRLRDKLLVILSENSVQSEWVGDEVEAALEEEKDSGRLVLFPIRLDDAVMDTRDDWAAKIKRRRHIGDFSNWQDEGSYRKAFERLLRDLKAENV